MRWQGWRRGDEALLLSVSVGQKGLCHCHKYFSTHQLLPTHHHTLHSNNTQTKPTFERQFKIGAFSKADWWEKKLLSVIQVHWSTFIVGKINALLKWFFPSLVGLGWILQQAMDGLVYHCLTIHLFSPLVTSSMCGRYPDIWKSAPVQIFVKPRDWVMHWLEL